MELSDNAQTTVARKSHSLAAGQWWRWTRYELRDGYLCPSPKARLRVYKPRDFWLERRPTGRRSDQEDRGATPYRALLDVLHRLEYRSDSPLAPEYRPAEVDIMLGSLTPESEQLILDWCAAYGLLGIMPHRVLQAVLPARAGRQIQFDRIDGIGWRASERERGNPHRPILEPRAIVQPLRGAGLTIEPLATTWARFFPGLPANSLEIGDYPQPLTKPFWRFYAEPLTDFLSGARALREMLDGLRMQPLRKLRQIHDALTGGLPVLINALVAPVGIAPALQKNGQAALSWVGNSLLSSLAMMLLEDVAQGRALQCECGQLFVSNAYQARYCSERCRWRFQQRRYRQ